MKINLSELKYKCLSRGELPGCCKGCPANVDDSISDRLKEIFVDIASNYGVGLL